MWLSGPPAKSNIDMVNFTLETKKVKQMNVECVYVCVWYANQTIGY